MRNKGIYKTPQEKREKIFEAYNWLTSTLKQKIREKKILNYNDKSLQDKLHKKKYNFLGNGKTNVNVLEFQIYRLGLVSSLFNLD